MTKEDYRQPDFYRFNQDSLELVRWVLRKVAAASSILDLGAGCGVLGLELSRTLLPETLTLVELQREYEPFLASNVKVFLPNCVEAQILIGKFSEFSSGKKFELIVCNPPYYLPGRGEVSPNLHRAQARSFIVDSWAILLQKISQSLISTGSCFMVVPKDEWLFEYIEKEASLHRLRVEREDSPTLVFLSLRLNVD